MLPIGFKMTFDASCITSIKYFSFIVYITVKHKVSICALDTLLEYIYS